MGVGKFYLRVLIKAPDPTTVYGPYAYGLSGFSEVLQTFNGGPGQLGLHGTNQPATNHSAFISMASNIMIVKAVSTPPPSAIST